MCPNAFSIALHSMNKSGLLLFLQILFHLAKWKFYFSFLTPHLNKPPHFSKQHSLSTSLSRKKNLEILLDTSLFFISHIKCNINPIGTYPQDISRIWLLLLTTTVVFLVQFTIIPGMDYCNSLLPVGLLPYNYEIAL